MERPKPHHLFRSISGLLAAAVLAIGVAGGISCTKQVAQVGARRAPASLSEPVLAGGCVARALQEILAHPYAATQERFLRSLNRLSAEESRHVERTLEALHFIDYEHSASDLLRVFLGETRFEKLRVADQYDGGLKVFGFQLRKKHPAFDNYLAARGYLDEVSSKPLEFEQIRETHRLAMKGGIENLTEDDLGTIRTWSVYGSKTQKPLTRAQLDNIENNPYLSFERTEELLHGETDGFHGKIWYPTTTRVKPEALQRIEAAHPELVRQIKVYQLEMKGRRMESPELNNQLISALVNERLEWFIREKGRIGPLSDPDRVDAYISLVAQFQRELVSIHPFRNGNGRVSRLIMDSLLEREGLPPPRLLRPDADIEESLDDWIASVREGVIATRRLREDFSERLKLGLPLENSPELVTPYIPRAVAVDRKLSSGKIEEKSRLTDLDARQYATWLRARLEANRALRTEWESDPVSASRRFAGEYEKFARSKHVDYVHRTKGKLEVELNLVDRDFIDAFGTPWAGDAAKWKRKMELWHRDQLVYRGLSSRSRELSEEEILRKFVEVDSHLASNQISGSAGARLQKLAKEDFERYNRDLLDGSLMQMATDHSQTGPLYASSYGYSTSTAQSVGEAFAMGAMVVGPYGKHRAPELQALLKDRIVVGMYQAKKDVELNTLHQLEPGFKSVYARQREIMGIGAADPDSVMLVQRIDAEAKVIQSWVRNPERPDEVWVIRGEFYPEPGHTPPPDLLLRTVHLKF